MAQISYCERGFENKAIGLKSLLIKTAGEEERDATARALLQPIHLLALLTQKINILAGYATHTPQRHIR